MAKPGLAIAIMSKAKPAEGDKPDMEDTEMDSAAESDAAADVMESMRAGDEKMFAEALKAFIHIVSK